jgi:hypothetical protein
MRCNHRGRYGGLPYYKWDQAPGASAGFSRQWPQKSQSHRRTGTGAGRNGQPGHRTRCGGCYYDHLLPLLQELTPEQQDELSEKILDATSLEEIHAWLKSIRGN